MERLVDDLLLWIRRGDKAINPRYKLMFYHPLRDLRLQHHWARPLQRILVFTDWILMSVDVWDYVYTS